MKKILFMIPNLSVGGAEKVLVNLVNNLDKSQFDITVQTLFGGGVNEQFLSKDIKYKYCFKKTFRANSQILKLFSKEFLFRKFIKEHYDIVVSYLEGPTARIVAGCEEENTKLISWIHVQQDTKNNASYSFRSYNEAQKCYSKYDRIVCVSDYVKQDFLSLFDIEKPIDVLYNTNETNRIIELSFESLSEPLDENSFKLCVVGKITKKKGCDRIARIQKKMLDCGLNTHLYYLGVGPEEDNIKQFAVENGIADSITFLGYQTNPYKYIKQCDLFVSASYAEGFNTAATEALILGVPVCTVDVSGMKEMLGENNEYGIVTENNEDALYEGINKILTTPGLLDYYASKALKRGKAFSTEKTTKAVEEMLLSL